MECYDHRSGGGIQPICVHINSTCDSLADTTEIDCLYMYIANGTSLHTVTQDHFGYSLGILN